MSTLAESAEKFEPVAGHVIYLAAYGIGNAWSAAERANTYFAQIKVWSTLNPTEALVIAGCIDAQVAFADGVEIDVDEIVRQYWKADKADYIERNMLGALSRFGHLLERLDLGLTKLAIPTQTRAEWVRRGLDFPPGDGAQHHVGRTPVDRQAWDTAGERVDEFLAYVAGLPYELRSGEVDLARVLPSVADAVGKPS